MDLLQDYLIQEAPILLFICCFLLFIVGFYLWFCYFPHQVLKRCGFNGPPPSFFFGNYKEMARYGTINYLEHLKKKYGKIVGFYNGRQPIISVTDLDLIKDITVKNFEYFTGRRLCDVNLLRAANIPITLLNREGDEWRRARRVLTPTFSASKLKLMEPLICKSAKILVKKLEEHSPEGTSMEMFRTYGKFTMETILSAAFGQVIDIQNGESNVITEAAANVFAMTQEGTTSSPEFMEMLTSNIPFLKIVFQRLLRHTKAFKGLKILMDVADEMIKKRTSENSRKHKDFLQLIMDAEFEEDGHVKKLPSEEIISHSITFMLAGYETTAIALTYTSYLLALNPDVQVKLQEEIDEYFESNSTSSLYQAVQDLKYLDMVLNESFRFHSPAPKFLRLCTKRYIHGEFTIPKGALLFVPSILIHKDPEYWENPEEFNVLRFLPEEKAKHPQMSFLPFGSGPRNCIGMRFALMEAKIALIEIMKKISFVRAPDTEVPLKTNNSLTNSPKNGVYLKIASRN